MSKINSSRRPRESGDLGRDIIKVEVIYISPTEQCLQSLEVPPDSTVKFAIEMSGILTLFPEINLEKQKVGIFSKFCALTDKVKAGDRIEIYRPLLIDPKEARRSKAKKK